MRITLAATNNVIDASNLISATLRFDLVPVPVTLEFTVQSTPELEKGLKEGAELFVGDVVTTLTLIKVQPPKTQLIKEGRRVGGIACVAILSGCKRLIEASSKAVILKQTSLNSVLRACGANTSLGDDLPLPTFVCLKGSTPSIRFALYLQQEAAVIAYRKDKVSGFKIDDLLNQEPIEKLDPSAVTWINSAALEKQKKSSYVSIDVDGTTPIGDDTTVNGRSVIQRTGLDARQLKNMEKVLIHRGTVLRPLEMKWRAGDVFSVMDKKYLILTVAHHVETGALGGASATASKIWLASL